MNIKSEKGITLASLIVYIIAMLITITIITVVTGYFSNNIDITVESYTYYSEYTKFESYFSEEINRQNNRIVEIADINNENNELQQRYVAFSSGNQYTYIPDNHAIYQNNVKIASGVYNCNFTESIVNGKQAITVDLVIKGNAESTEHTRQTKYILDK